LAQRCQLVGGQARAPGRMEDGVQVAARQRRSAFGDGCTRADELDFRVVCKRVAELLEPFAGSGRVDADALAVIGFRSAHRHHLVKKGVLESSTLRGLFCAPDGGRRISDSEPHLRAQYVFCHCWSVARSWTEKASCCAPSLVSALRSAALRTSRFR